MHYTATFRTHPLPQAAGVQHFFLDDDEPPAAGSRPDRLSAVSRPQERVLRRSVAQIEVTVPSVPILDVPVPQMVDQLVVVLQGLGPCLSSRGSKCPRSLSKTGSRSELCFESRCRWNSWWTCLCQRWSSWHVARAHLVSTGAKLLLWGGREEGFWWQVGTRNTRSDPIHRQPKAVYEYWTGLSPLWTSL